jgi:hypothetical protein
VLENVKLFKLSQKESLLLYSVPQNWLQTKQTAAQPTNL